MVLSSGTSDQDERTAAPRRGAGERWSRVILLIVAAFESWTGLSSLPFLSERVGGDFGDWVVTVSVALTAAFASAALFFCVTDRLRYALTSIAAVVVLNWVNMLPSVVLHGLDFNGFGIVSDLGFILYPVLAVTAVVLARTNERLLPASVLVSIPTLVNVAGIVAFGISVALYGF
jgi:hypothetical protein